MSGPAPAAGNAGMEALTGLLHPMARQEILDEVLKTVQTIVFALVYALVIFIIGWIVIKIVMYVVNKILKKKKLDETVHNFIISVIGGILKLFLFTFVLGALGIELLSLGAIVGALGLAIGLTLGGLMTNFISGLLLLTRKPFVKDDYIEAQGYGGSVSEIGTYLTTLVTPDNKVVFIPNSPLVSDTVVNYSANETRRVDLVVGVAYDADLQKCKDIFTKICRRHKAVLDEPATNVRVHELGDSSVNFIVRPWVKKADYWSFYWDFHHEVKERLDAAGIGIPFPQQDVHIFKGEPNVPQDIEWSETQEPSEVEDVSPTKEKLSAKKVGKKALSAVKKGSDLIRKRGKGKKKGEKTEK